MNRLADNVLTGAILFMAMWFILTNHIGWGTLYLVIALFVWLASFNKST